MSFSNRVKEKICRTEEGGACFGCGLLFSHAGCDKPYLLHTGCCEAPGLLEAAYERLAGRPMPCVARHSAGYRRRAGAAGRPLSTETVLGFAEPEERSKEQILGVFGKWKAADGRVTLDDSFYSDGELARSFLRGLFVANGTVSDPERGYRLEFRGLTRPQADELMRLLAGCGWPARLAARSGRFVVYFKGADQIEYMLAFLGAPGAMMSLAYARMRKDKENNLNRMVNCDAANLRKARGAAGRSIEDIRLIYSRLGEDFLPEPLRSTARARLENEDASLSELGEILGTGKSGVCHRLARIRAVADSLRKGDERS